MFAADPQLADFFDVDVIEGEHKPSYNEAPSQMVRSIQTKRERPRTETISRQGSGPADDAPFAQGASDSQEVEAQSGQRVLNLKQWGLVPFWAKDNFRPLINARAETVTEKPSFRTAVSRRRVLIPTNGYYEWQTEPDGSKQPFFLSLADTQGNSAPPGREPVLAMAGIYEGPSRSAKEQFVEQHGEDVKIDLPNTAALLTREAADTIGEIHPRMPLFVPRDLWDIWLDPSFTDNAELQNLINSIQTPPLVPRPVGRAVGNVRNNFPGLLDPINLGSAQALKEADEGTLPGL